MECAHLLKVWILAYQNSINQRSVWRKICFLIAFEYIQNCCCNNEQLWTLFPFFLHTAGYCNEQNIKGVISQTVLMMEHSLRACVCVRACMVDFFAVGNSPLRYPWRKMSLGKERFMEILKTHGRDVSTKEMLVDSLFELMFDKTK